MQRKMRLHFSHFSNLQVNLHELSYAFGHVISVWKNIQNNFFRIIPTIHAAPNSELICYIFASFCRSFHDFISSFLVERETETENKKKITQNYIIIIANCTSRNESAVVKKWNNNEQTFFC